VLQRLSDILEKILFFVAGAGLMTSVGLAFAAVIMRYIFNFSLEWVEEAARYLALFAAFLVAGPVLRDGGHVALDLLTSGLERVARQVHRLAVNAIALVVGAAIFVWGMRLMLDTMEFGLLTGSLQFPQWLPYSIVPLGMAFLVLFSFFEIMAAVDALRTGRTTTAHSRAEPQRLAEATRPDGA